MFILGSTMEIWDEVFKNGPSKIYGRQALLQIIIPCHFKFFKGCLPQILLSPFLNTLFYKHPWWHEMG